MCAHVFAGNEQTNLPHRDWVERKGTEAYTSSMAVGMCHMFIKPMKEERRNE